MATRSNIAVQISQTKVISVYCHFDGYPSHHLPILNEHYNTLEKALELISEGNISVLDEKETIYYGRDKKELNQQAVISDIDNWLKQQYGYLFTLDKTWKVFE
jgi:hypothetical protein